MKKHFKNVLLKSNRKNGWLVCVCAICLTLMSGAMVGCSAVKNLSSEVQAQTNLTDMTSSENGDTQTVLPVDNTDTLYDPPKTDGMDTQTIPAQEPDTNENSEENLSADAQEIKNLVEEFAAAYFSGNIDAVQRLLPDTYDWDIDVYEGTGTISDITLKGLPETDEQPEGTVMVVSVEHRNSDFGDTLQYLTIELIKQNGRWEIQFYGLEG